MGIIDSATNAISAVKNVVSTAPATSLSGIVDKVGGAISGAFGALGVNVKNLSGVKLPLKNPLFAYASYDYVISLGCLTEQEISYPDTTYKAGKPVRLICKSANAEPNNRVKTPYGKFDFFIDNVEIVSQIGLVDGNNTNVTGINFTVTEPYSMGIFNIACQQLAQDLGWDNFREAPFVLVIEFRGNKELGQIEKIPNTTRHIPFNFTDVSMTVTEAGAVYKCSGMPSNQIALTDQYAQFKSDVSIKGTTVQEILQTGEKSLQAVINKRFQQLVEQKIVKVADEIVILFPQDTASAAGGGGEGTSSESRDSATATPGASPKTQGLFEKLGVTRSSKNNTLIQEEGLCNALGKASLGFDDSRKGDTPVGKDNKVWDPDKQVFVRGNNDINIKESDFKFRQDTDITNAINQVLLNSDVIKGTFDASMLSPEGMRGWWRIDVQTYPIPTSENLAATGVKPKLIVYRVVPYEVHASNMMPPNTKAPGFDNLKQQVVKEYNYIYTGKNVDVLKFEIQITQGFMTIMGADGLEKSQDVKQAAQNSEAPDPVAIVSPLGLGSLPSRILGNTPTIVSYTGTVTGTDKKGGGGTETSGTRAARLFMDAVTEGTDMYDLNLQIIGDPYFIVDSGIGNWTDQQTQFKNLNANGSVNWQNGEVDIKVNFRTPIDINQNTGLYNFTPQEKSAPVMQYSGLYRVTDVTSRFSGGIFTQELTGFRRPGQENLFEAPASSTFNLSKAIVDMIDKFNTRD